MKRKTDPAVRFWANVNKQGPELRPDLGACWEYRSGRYRGGKPMAFGYARIWPGQGQAVLAHRFSWTLAYGDPGELCVLHKCDHPPCVRPDHLFLGTRPENMADKVAKGRQHRGERTGGALLTSIALMRWMVRLLTREGELVGDLFAGSGTTGIAAALENRNAVLCDMAKEAVEIGCNRLMHWHPMGIRVHGWTPPEYEPPPVIEKPSREPKKRVREGKPGAMDMPLFGGRE